MKPLKAYPLLEVIKILRMGPEVQDAAACWTAVLPFRVEASLLPARGVPGRAAAPAATPAAAITSTALLAALVLSI